MDIEVENIKCGGCANSIEGKLLKIEGVNSVTIDIEKGIVSTDGTDDSREAVCASLLSMGYPEVGAVSGIKGATTKAKSFVSCAIGKMS